MKKGLVNLLALLLAVTSLPAQDRSREILNANYDPGVILIDATMDQAAVVRVRATDRSQYRVYFRIVSSPDSVRDWAKEADNVLEGVVAVRPGETVKTKTSRLFGIDGEIFELTREATQKTARFALFFSDRDSLNTIDQPITKRQAGNFIAAMRRAAGAADTIAALRHAAAADPNAAAPLVKPLGRGQTYFEFQVEKPADLLAGVSKMPVYPPALLSTGLRGQVAAQFVVDENGSVDTSTFKVLRATNPLFAESVRDALPGIRYSPAVIGEQRVKQLVQQLFNFSP